MDITHLIESFADFAKQKNIDRPTMIRILEDVFRNMIRKKYGVDDNFDVSPLVGNNSFRLGCAILNDAEILSSLQMTRCSQTTQNLI